jgi:hypothetical protein
MAQTWVMPPAGTDFVHTVLKTTVPDALEALRTCHSGASEPASKVAHMLWADTATGWLKIRNAANTAWLKVAPLAYDQVQQLGSEGWAGTLSASKTAFIGQASRPGTVKRLVLFSSAGSTSSSGNEVRVQVAKYPFATPASPVNLISANVGTFTALGGVGGGVEHVADKALVYTPNQNLTFAELDLFKLVVTYVGAPTATLTDFRAHLEVE